MSCPPEESRAGPPNPNSGPGKDNKYSPGEGIVKKHFQTIWKVCVAISVALLAGLAATLISHVHACTTNQQCNPITIWWKVAYGIWIVGVPIYFFVEWVYGVDWKVAHDPNNKHRLDYFKECQSQARTVWAAFATALGLLLLKSN